MTEVRKDHPATEGGPDFVFGGKRVISEDSWAEYEAEGIENIVESIPTEDTNRLREMLVEKGRLYGAENVLLGDAYDVAEGRPLRHKPGIGVYVSRVGKERYEHGGGEAGDQGQDRRPPVLKLPDGRRIVAKPGTRVKLPTRDEDANAREAGRR